MKKIILLAAFGVAGMMSANSIEFIDEASAVASARRSCVGVESDCGNGGTWFACEETNSEGQLDYELVDEMRQNLNEAFCEYGD